MTGFSFGNGLSILGGSNFDLYVDSVHGDDANSGATAALAKRTIAGLGLIQASKSYGLACGSYWREQFNSTAATVAYVAVGTYGSGRMPILDCADIVGAGSWTKTAGRTNIWQATITSPLLTSLYPSLWQDGVRVRWISSLDLLDPASGVRFYTPNPAVGTSFVLYVNADPTTDGKVYETAVRYYGLVGSGVNWRVNNIHTMRNLHNDGSMVVTGIGSTINGILVEDGTKHNALFGRGVTVTGAIGWKCDWSDRTNIDVFVSYDGDARGYSTAYSGCVVKIDPQKSILAIANAQAIGAFFNHSGGGALIWDAITYSDCSVYGSTGSFGANDVKTPTFIRCLSRCSLEAIVITATTSFAVTDLWIDGVGDVIEATDGITVNVPGTIDGLRSYTNASDNKGDVYSTASVAISVTGSVFARKSGASGYKYFIDGGNAATITSTQNIVYGPNGGNAENGYASKAGGAADNNVYWNSGLDFSVGVTGYTNFTLYRAANPTLDVHSVSADPLLVDPANGNFSVQSSSPAIALNAGLARPNIAYTPIPSDAALAAM